VRKRQRWAPAEHNPASLHPSNRSIDDNALIPITSGCCNEKRPADDRTPDRVKAKRHVRRSTGNTATNIDSN